MRVNTTDHLPWSCPECCTPTGGGQEGMTGMPLHAIPSNMGAWRWWWGGDPARRPLQLF